ncbi:MAG: hypothetical protein ACEY3F_02560 [Wolbachia sp.]|uniref:hypothetical protein n=1 Tax=unclassified Wolbachia TaxID=2640676 RepID=UPI0011EDC66A|nr:MULTISPECIES: hypothetical protein [unclassified Wolbachia]QEK90207.1 hypothetical protein CAI20_06275 [Wolbachia endosymbiont of Chrysomya megacephala]
MPNNETRRGYPLPHPENIAVQDVVRIRKAVEKIDEDMSERESKYNDLQKAFERLNFENFLNFWSNNR